MLEPGRGRWRREGSARPLRRRYEILNLRGGGVNGKERETVKANQRERKK